MTEIDHKVLVGTLTKVLGSVRACPGFDNDRSGNVEQTPIGIVNNHSMKDLLISELGDRCMKIFEEFKIGGVRLSQNLEFGHSDFSKVVCVFEGVKDVVRYPAAPHYLAVEVVSYLHVRRKSFRIICGEQTRNSKSN